VTVVAGGRGVYTQPFERFESLISILDLRRRHVDEVF